MSRIDGGPAFPHDAAVDGHPCPGPGMSLRDYFAAKAMQSMASRNNQNPNTIMPDAINAYRWADAMLKVRKS